MLSLSFFLDHLKSIFEEIGSYIETAGILFACFVIIKFLIDVVLFSKSFSDTKTVEKLN